MATVFCLHGRGGNQDAAFDQLFLPDMAAESHLPLAIASVDGGDHSYWHPRSDGTDPMAMLVDELVPFIEKQTKTTKRALHGFSMGGYGALLAAEEHPGMFAAVAALSPAVWSRWQDSAPKAFDRPEDFRAHSVLDGRSRLRPSELFFACGRSDPFYPATRAFAASLPGSGTNFGLGGHNLAYWRSVSPEALTFLFHKVGT